jgi:hypothetical protein
MLETTINRCLLPETFKEDRQKYWAVYERIRCAVQCLNCKQQASKKNSAMVRLAVNFDEFLISGLDLTWPQYLLGPRVSV